ncbi:protein O-glucosyltransferase 1-like [Sesamum indicum]|uniref:Protein O-glucosyltransferase 1-like n=1 Tax=Sesamum indicum TaxID=4182 RepID=A0A8M8V3Z2_SESIN|nr:protein O-glucosyltransferase 1-like [Sesamum indicum]
MTAKMDHTTPSKITKNVENTPTTIIVPALNCSMGNLSRRCLANSYSTKTFVRDKNISSTLLASCPDYFRWIHEDLWPWRRTGITREMVMRANRTANFRLVILDGKAYAQTYSKGFQSRDTFTLWGILQLLRRYPGKVPDLDLMFDCDDLPVIRKENFKGVKHSAPPTLFGYCKDDSTLNIVFPDWSFWGWPEINIKPWEALSKDLKAGNKRSSWTEREPNAYWKGNPYVAATRIDLLDCNVSDKLDWGARIYAQDWQKEEKEGFKQSDLASQCTHRDLMPLQHYWPIKDDDKCRSIKHAVDWGNSHREEAQAIGKTASSFVLNELKMDYVYDYMFHLLSEYSKLLKYKPTVPDKAVELCSEAMACRAQGLEKKFMTDTLVKGPSFSSPCTMPPPYGPASFHSVIEKKRNGIKQAEKWENESWQNQNKQV